MGCHGNGRFLHLRHCRLLCGVIGRVVSLRSAFSTFEGKLLLEQHKIEQKKRELLDSKVSRVHIFFIGIGVELCIHFWITQMCFGRN